HRRAHRSRPGWPRARPRPARARRRRPGHDRRGRARAARHRSPAGHAGGSARRARTRRAARRRARTGARPVVPCRPSLREGGLLAGHFGVEQDERAVYDHRLAADPAEYASSLLRATNTEVLLVDDGFPPEGEGTTWDELGELGGCLARPILRLETRGEHAAEE